MITDLTLRSSLLNTAFRMTLGMSVLMSHASADILRGGGGKAGAAPPAANSTPAGGNTPAATNQARTNTTDTLARTTQALAAVRAMQLAARNNAINGPNNLGNHPVTGSPLPNVPDGLGSGGLKVDVDPLTGNPTWWQGAELPTQTSNGTKVEVTVKQTAQQALLNWESFNIGKNTTLNFDQSAAGSNVRQWIAFNKVTNSDNPTQILGNIKAQGQVYIINNNGIIFGGSSQVNTGALTVSAMPINDDLVTNGLLNNPNQVFLFDGLGKGRIGDVTVQAGAQISTPVSADGNGGRIFLTGANVTNNGTLSSASGQVILAAGLQVGVVAHNNSDPSLRGLDVFVGAVVDPASSLSPYAGTVTNSGLIEIQRASALLTGKTIQQNGVIDSTTSVSLNGRVDLLANYDAVGNPGYVASNPNTGSAFVWRSTGNVTLGENSVIQILPETGSAATAVGTKLALRSQINIQGKNIHHAEGSILLAPNAIASINAGTWAFVDSPNLPTSTFYSTGGQVFLDKGSVINLAGTTNALASVLQNIIELQLRGSELSVAPVQRDGELRGETIVVDLGKTGTYEGREWVGTPLADLIGYLGLVQRDVAQLTTAGGTLSISAGDAAVVREGSLIDVSGGWTNFQGGVVATTRVVSNGQIVDISQATPDQVYSGIYTGNSSVVHSKWGVVESFNRALAPAGTRYQEGYTQGADAGSVTITAPAIVLDGTLRGNTVAGGNQIRNEPGSSNLPEAAKLALHFRGRENVSPNYFVTYPDALDIVFQEGVEQEDVGDFVLDENGDAAAIPTDRKNNVYLSPDLLTDSGFGHLEVTNEDGRITVAEGQNLTTSPGGSISLTASNIDIRGNVTAAGGSLSFTALNISPYDAAVALSQPIPEVPAYRSGRGVFTLAEGATLSTAGLVTDDRNASSYDTPAIPDGGSISIQAYTADLREGSLVDVSGGYAMNSDGKGRYGNAGAISVLAGKDPRVSSILGGTLSLDGTLRGISGAKGGTLTLQAGAIQVGGSAGQSGVFHIDPAFFDQGGFTKFNLQGLGGPGLTAVSVAPGTIIEPIAKRLAVVANSPGGGLLLGEYEAVHGRAPDVSERQAVSLSFSSDGVRDAATGLLLHRGDVVIGEGSVIRTDPGATVEVKGNTATVLGSIYAAAGTIRVSGSTNTNAIFGDPNQALATTYLGSNSVLSATGSVVLKPDAYGRRIGSVLGGGSISVSGNIVAAAGAALDVSGTSGTLDVDPSSVVSNPVAKIPGTGLTNKPRVNQTVPVQVDSNAGSISLAGGQFLFSDATLRGNAGGASAEGGTLSVSSGRFYGVAETPSPSDITLSLTQSGPVLANPVSGNPIGQAITGSLGSGHGFLAADSFQSGGFDSLSLSGVLETRGAVTIDARGQVSLANQGILFNESNFTIHAGAVSLGMAFRPPTLPGEETSPIVYNGQPFIIPATYGSGTLDINASHIDVGSLSLQGTGAANLVAENGDVRGNGTFIMAGDLKVRAGQIYPTTASEFNLIAYDYQNGSGSQKGSITIESSGSRSLPYSAGGKLGIYASTIHQGGVLRAPFGTITLGWDGSGTAPRDWLTGTTKPFPVTTDLTLASGSITSVSAVDPKTGKALVLPYGYSPDGTVWIDPRGVDITAGGLPEKAITLSGGNLVQEAGSTIDLRGGGDLYADRWVSGLGGPVDILTNPNSYAIVPAYGADYAPYAPYNGSTSASNLIQGASGYTNGSLSVGDKVYLEGSKTLAAGYYTLLPARYALLPGAVLVTASQAGGLGSLELPGGASVVNGYRYNSLDGDRSAPQVSTRFEVASSKVVRQRAQYFDFLANTFIKQSAATLNAPVPVLPTDSGYLRFQATQSMELAGAVASKSISGGRGAAIDISTQLDTLISHGGSSGSAGAITLDATALNAFGAESLLIGGTRSRNSDGSSTVTVSSGKITVDNDGAPLAADDLILVAKNELVLAPGAELASTGTTKSNADTLKVVGDGALVRVSGNPAASVLRSGNTSSVTPLLTVGAGASIRGGSIILDSTSRLSLDSTATLAANAYTFGAGRVSVMLNPNAAVPSTGSLVLDNSFLGTLSASSSLGLLSYSSIDLHGAGSFGSSSLANLTLSAGEIRGVDQGGGTARLVAKDVLLQNPNGSVSTSPGASSGTLEISAETIRLGSNQIALNQYADVRLAASRGIIGEGKGGLSTQSALTLDAPRLTGAAGAVRTITAGGDLVLASTSGSSSGLASGGPGSTLTLTGSSVSAGGEILLESGNLTLHATTGDVLVNGKLDVSGNRRIFGDTARYYSAGSIKLGADAGDVVVAESATLDLSAHAGGGNAGSLSISNPVGGFVLDGTLLAKGGQGGSNGNFSLDTSGLLSLESLASKLSAASFTNRQEFRIRGGNVTLDGTSVARDFLLSADQGKITVSGTVDASGATGGSIRLVANGDLVLEKDAVLDASATNFSSAGKGGAITLEAGASRDGVAGIGEMKLKEGSTIDLSVAAEDAGSAALGKFGGKLHLRLPQLDGEINMGAIDSTITGASSILVEGYKIYDLTGTAGTITTATQNQIKADGEAFLGAAGSASDAYATITDRLLAHNEGLGSILVLAPGAEVINRTGNLTLGSTTSTSTSDWNLAGYRFGTKSAAGVLTLRASGNLTLYNTISDGFELATYNSLLLPGNTLLPTNTRSYSYRLVSGADFSSTDFGKTQSVEALAANAGSLILGKNNTNNFSNSNGSTTNNPGTSATTAAALANRYQVIRTGTGDIDIHAGRSVQLQNHFATIYTAGTVVADLTMGGTFDLPKLDQSQGTVTLGANQQPQPYAPQYSMAGGDVSIFAGLDIEHISRTNQNVVIADSQRQLPNNWLYRRGYVEADGTFGNSQGGDEASTTWWVDFSNFFQGIGALGGGDVTLVAGNNVNNVDAVIPTNARMPKGRPDASKMVELGGGDLIVRAGNNIDAGVYYVERGRGSLQAGGSIVTNSTRSPSIPQLGGTANTFDSSTWLPTTLFLGKGSFDVTSLGDLLLGPVANPFLLPPGINNTFWQKSYFSTYDKDSSVSVASVGGSVTLRQGATLPASGAGSISPILWAWIDRQQVLRSNPASASYYQPWLRLAETSVDSFRTVVSLLPPTLDVTSFGSNINLVGNLTLAPSATGNLELLAGGAINGLQRNGRVTFNGTSGSWGSSRINVSDADPNAIPGIASPFGYTSLVGYDPNQARSTRGNFLESVNRLFRETGATEGSQAILQVKQALHAAGLLHRDDDEPVRLYAGSGDISGLTLFSPKAALIYAARDITDVAFYLQNLSSSDTSVVAAGRDIIPSNANSLLRLLAGASGNVVNNDSPANAGDIQISGPGTLQVLAGRNLDLGAGAELADGTGAGISSIGNARNPALPGNGANLIVGAGITDATSLANSSLDFSSFIAEYVNSPQGEAYLKELAPGVDFASLADEEQARLALGVFYLILRDAGRNYAMNGNYDTALEAIKVLFGENPVPGDILTRGRSIRTTRGGAINLLTPGGGLTLANTAIGNPLSPPGIITESGGDIFTFAKNDVNIGIGRIFTLRGGNQVIWSTEGDIAAGSSSKTVTSAPPTRVLIDPQSASVQTDLAGLATGGGIGALATVAGVPLGDVDLVAPEGTVDAGDAGIRVSGNLNISANQVVNAGNISVGGSSSGTPSAPSAPSVATVTNAATAAAATSETAAAPAPEAKAEATETVIEEPESEISVEVLGYGGSDDEEEEEETP
ncbi:filamentous haemagglutinin family protein [Luteolibacter luteus]|uniref:Filamentous hemagglutinin N-terminal domain-containing protein n=1 Tax=Luteolibacter luteus TaxID=2728835 RepID=A0A858RP53_9BACT|nr:filamentous haemagglutinin family protein [Luteolibacter luteus]QJE97910.1 filamentous hemagglutinin N-terminal domain-containing protein [Luteolibacter luteus]